MVCSEEFTQNPSFTARSKWVSSLGSESFGAKYYDLITTRKAQSQAIFWEHSRAQAQTTARMPHPVDTAQRQIATSNSEDIQPRGAHSFVGASPGRSHEP